MHVCVQRESGKENHIPKSQVLCTTGKGAWQNLRYPSVHRPGSGQDQCYQAVLYQLAVCLVLKNGVLCSGLSTGFPHDSSSAAVESRSSTGMKPIPLQRRGQDNFVFLHHDPACSFQGKACFSCRNLAPLVSLTYFCVPIAKDRYCSCLFLVF